MALPTTDMQERGILKLTFQILINAVSQARLAICRNEEIMDSREWEYSRVYAQIDLDAIRANVEHIGARMERAKVLAVVKCDGYGHGSVPIARAIEDMEAVGGYATATAEEALELRRAGIEKPILILGYTFP